MIRLIEYPKRGRLAKFYNSKKWDITRRVYKASVNGLCEICASYGYIVAGVEVHHRIPLTLDNYTDCDIAYNFNNLILLCIKCHSNAHRTDNCSEGCYIDEGGNVRATPRISKN